MQVTNILENLRNIAHLGKAVTVPVSYVRTHYLSTAFFAGTAASLYNSWNLSSWAKCAPQDQGNIEQTKEVLGAISKAIAAQLGIDQECKIKKGTYSRAAELLGTQTWNDVSTKFIPEVEKARIAALKEVEGKTSEITKESKEALLAIVNPIMTKLRDMLNGDCKEGASLGFTALGKLKFSLLGKLSPEEIMRHNAELGTILQGKNPKEELELQGKKPKEESDGHWFDGLIATTQFQELLKTQAFIDGCSDLLKELSSEGHNKGKLGAMEEADHKLAEKNAELFQPLLAAIAKAQDADTGGLAVKLKEVTELQNEETYKAKQAKILGVAIGAFGAGLFCLFANHVPALNRAFSKLPITIG